MPLIIRETPHWLWRVHTNQAHLGHMVFIAARETDGSLADCSAEEWRALHGEIALFERLMAGLFAPARFNYTQFGNEWARLHVHGFPRHRDAPEWNDRRFPDKQWGAAPIPEPPSPLEGEALAAFADWLGKELAALA